ncbi:methyltransferase domain-containing protein [Nakamurella endophytica]|uniref:SAM-dependent methyltransferase n=1 Tax=Nakamurella endophytica TaxID=1748367 RepID=A0A917SZV8_9ACTN|nr:methyltransferase domain-containing protein [Nakamurella endophytica]GGM05449.1 SAM-dependent methyltransferase [Nakamurella endophytica]
MTGPGPSAGWRVLACPHCGAPLSGDPDGPAGVAGRRPRVLGCPLGHRFDVARQGYVALLGPRSRTDTGDSADMVAARVEFLGAGHYAPISVAVADAAGASRSGAATSAAGTGEPVLLEIGAGTGHYLSAALDRIPGAAGVGLDSSRYAARRAATDPRTCSVLADAWSRLPLVDQAADVVLSVFAPRDLAEVARVLRPGGSLVAVTPRPGHLVELRERVGLLSIDPDKADALEQRARRAGLRPTERTEVRSRLRLTRAAVAALVRMGPAARHLDPADLARRVAALDEPVEATLDVSVSVLVADR